MNSTHFILTICLLILSIILYIENLNYKRINRLQAEEMKRLNIEHQKLYTRLFAEACSPSDHSSEREIKTLLQQKPFIESNWSKIEVFINNTQNQFVHRLNYNFPNLSTEDIHIILLMRLHLTSKEIATFYNIQLSSLNTKRYRLKKKMELDNSISIIEYINNLYVQEPHYA